MLYAVTGPTLDRIYFLRDRPDEPGLEVEADVRVEPLAPMPQGDRAEGTDGPEPILCRSKSDSKLYKEFNLRREIDFNEFEDVGKRFGGIFSKADWAKLIRGGTASELARRWDESTRIRATMTDETDTDEVWDQVLRNLGVDPVTGHGLES